MSQINPFRGVVIPSARPQGVQVHKDRQQRRGAQKEGEDSTQGESTEQPQTPDDGKPHVDLKA